MIVFKDQIKRGHDLNALHNQSQCKRACFKIAAVKAGQTFAFSHVNNVRRLTTTILFVSIEDYITKFIFHKKQLFSYTTSLNANRYLVAANNICRKNIKAKKLFKVS